MAAVLIDGVRIADEIREQVRARVDELSKAGRPVQLTAILIGSSPAGEIYAARQKAACEAVGIFYDLMTLPEDIDQPAAERVIHRLNGDVSVTGIMLHLPVPRHLNETALQYAIDPRKDVEGVNPANIGYVIYGHTLIAPCTALAVLELIRSTGTPLRGAEAVVVGASEIVGKPVALLLTEEMATVTLCHVATRDLKAHTSRADIIVVAVGKAGLIGPDHVREGAVVIDVGINRITLADGTRKTVGDVDPQVANKAGYLSPVPGGVGPVTVAMLLKNTIRSANLLLEEGGHPPRV